jgi:taurine dioxygenase
MIVDVRPFDAPLGAEVHGVDLSQPVPPDAVHALRQAWHEHQVLVMRNQQLTADDQRRFVSYLGDLQQPRGKRSGLNPDILYVANVMVDGEEGVLPEGDMHFHADQCYYEIPTAGAVLFGIEIPSKGGHTLFANMYKAYDTLPPDIRSRIDGRDILFVYDSEKNSYKRVDLDAGVFPSFVHPAVIAHPHTSRPVLFINRLMADSVVGLPRNESDALLNVVFDHIEQPGMIYEHVWRKGDVVLWDNFSTLHARTDFDPSERRVLRRMAIRGQRPVRHGPAVRSAKEAHSAST